MSATDELRSKAKQLRGTAYMLDKIAIVSTPWIHANLTPMLREAADTIESLRDRLQEAGNVDAERDAIFAKAIRRIVEKNTDFSIVDIGESHRQADELLCDLLLSHGYIETVDEFKSMRKWYS